MVIKIQIQMIYLLQMNKLNNKNNLIYKIQNYLKKKKDY